MEFSYRVSEAQYIQAWKLASKGGPTARVVKRIMFWVLILICLLMLWAIVQRSSHLRRGEASEQTAPNGATQTTESSAPSDETAPGQSGPGEQIAGPKNTSPAHALLVNLAPALVAVLGLIFVLRFFSVVLRRNYRKSPSMQGEFTVDITPQSISIQNTAGTSYQSGWNVYEYWREGKDLITLKYIPSGYSILNVAGLSQSQRDELRGILATVLPRK